MFDDNDDYVKERVEFLLGLSSFNDILDESDLTEQDVLEILYSLGYIIDDHI